VLAWQREAQWQLTLAWASNYFIKLEYLFVTTINCVTKVFCGSLFDHCLINGVVSKQRLYCLECLLIHESRFSLPILINTFVILVSQLLCFCNNSFARSTNRQVPT
jgi:hypothetical protein